MAIVAAPFIVRGVMAREFAKRFYNSIEWQTARDMALKRTNYLCNRCGRPADIVHHIKRLTPYNIYDVNISLSQKNLEPLCKFCHHEEHKGEHASGRRVKDAYAYVFDAQGNLVPKERLKAF